MICYLRAGEFSFHEIVTNDRENLFEHTLDVSPGTTAGRLATATSAPSTTPAAAASISRGHVPRTMGTIAEQHNDTLPRVHQGGAALSTVGPNTGQMAGQVVCRAGTNFGKNQTNTVIFASNLALQSHGEVLGALRRHHDVHVHCVSFTIGTGDRFPASKVACVLSFSQL